MLYICIFVSSFAYLLFFADVNIFHGHISAFGPLYRFSWITYQFLRQCPIFNPWFLKDTIKWHIKYQIILFYHYLAYKYLITSLLSYREIYFLYIPNRSMKTPSNLHLILLGDLHKIYILHQVSFQYF